MSKSAIYRIKRQIQSRGWLGLALLLLVGPFNWFGLWEPVELRFAELSRRLAHQLFDARVHFFVGETFKSVTRGQLGQGELPFTSAAFAYALLGVKDYAGRIASLSFGLVAVISLWVLLGRFSRRSAQVFGAMALVSLPLFVWQSRLMLGDAATMGALSLATTGLSIACLDTGLRLQRILWGVLGIIGLVAGQLCRGVLIGVAVPALAVGIVGVRQAMSWSGVAASLQGNVPTSQSNGGVRLEDKRAGSAESRAAGLVRPLDAAVGAWFCLLLGLVAAGFGGFALWQQEPGFSFLLGANLKGPYQGGSFASEVAELLHAAFPWSAFLPVAVAVSASRRPTDEDSRREDALSNCLLLIALLTIAVNGAMALRAVAFPFPAVAALAGLSGIALARGHDNRRGARVAAVAVAAVATLVYSDFENLSEKRLLLTGVFAARVPEGFVAEHRQWLQLCLVTVLLGCVVAIVGERAPRERPFSRIRLNSLKEQATAVLGGHIASGLVLLETALGTTGLLVHAHERGFIYVPIFQSILPNLGGLLKYAWLGPPLVAMVVPLGFLIVREAATWVLSLGRSRAKRDVPPALVATSPTSHVPGVFAFRTTPSGVLAVALTLGGLCLTVGQMPRLGEQLSAKEALLQFSRLGKPGEPLALLGVGAQAARYYLSSPPKTFEEIGAAASWLAGGQANTRFMALAADELAPLNAAFRAQTSGSNLVLPASLRGRVLLAASRAIEGTTNHNPLADVVLAAQVHVKNVSSGEFGNAVRLEGWEFRELAGGVVDTLRRGEQYRLRLVFRVLDPPLVDWQIFVHLDGSGHRQNGDHDPSGGAYPTSLWQSGDIIVDDHTFALEGSSPPGRQRLYLGFFRNTTRWDVTRGNHDDNRLMVGDVTVQ